MSNDRVGDSRDSKTEVGFFTGTLEKYISNIREELINKNSGYIASTVLFIFFSYVIFKSVVLQSKLPFYFPLILVLIWGLLIYKTVLSPEHFFWKGS